MVRRGLARTAARTVRGAGRLRWRLTISYAAVTLVAAVGLSVASAVSQAARGAGSAPSVGPTATLEKSAASAAPYLIGPAPDAEALRFWVAIPLMDDESRTPGAHLLAVAVLDRAGVVLTADSCTRSRYTSSSAATCRADGQSSAEALLADPVGQQAITATVRASTAGPSTTATASGRGFVVTPVANDKQPVGALVAIFDRTVPVVPPQNRLFSFLALARATWSPSWLPLILLAILVGTVTGFGLSHQLVRRLRAMAGTARVWSAGDLRPTMNVRGRDEVARLGTDLNQMAEQLRNLLAARREIATMQERHRVHRDLHDGVKQELFAASLQLAAARACAHDEDPALAHLDEARACNQRAQHELTAIIEQLRPPMVSAAGLGRGIADLCSRFTDGTGLRVALEVVADVRVPDGVEDALIRITQEALTNIHRHARAAAIAVSLSEQDGQVILLIADDGLGPPAEAAGGLGLTSMRERAEAVGGTLEIQPAHPGTLVKVILPHGAGGAGNG